MDHDQRFKALIQLFFEEFMELFFKDWAKLFDFSHIEWLENEVFPNPPEGSRHAMDLVAKLKANRPVASQHSEDAKEWVVLVSIEIDSSDRAMTLRSKIPEYYFLLRFKHRLPVLPIGLFLKVGLDGIGTDVYEEYFEKLRVLSFEYLYVALKGLEAVEYIKGQSYLGIALAPS